MPEVLDVAIVGGGVAGLYAGYSLLERGDRPRVEVLEATDRTAGRLYTLVPPHAPHLRCEIGGMRFKSTQSLVVDLIDHLGLPHRPFPLGDMSDSHDLHYLRGSHFSLAELLAESPKVPYGLADDERGKSVPQILAKVIEGFVPDGATLTNDERVERERTQLFEGRPVTDASLVDVIGHYLSDEGFELVMDGLGYSCSRDPQLSAINMLHTDLAHGEHRTLDDGMQALPDALAQRFVEGGGRIRLNSPVHRVSQAEGGLLRLHTDQGEVLARHVILALTRRALEVIDVAGVEFDLDAVVPVPAGKLYLLFDRPWWEELGLPRGKSVTTLPMRQCLYFGVEDEAPGGDPDNRTGLLVASYTDGPSSAYWEQHQAAGGPMFAGRHDPPAALRAPAAMVADSLRQLAELHEAEIPEPIWAAYINWTADPVGAGWHYWRVGASSAEVIPRMRQPNPELPLSVCGEAFSAHQGWILGALSSTERVLQDVLGLPAPAWLSPDAELGP